MRLTTRLSLLLRSFIEMILTLGQRQNLHGERLLEEKAKIEALIHMIPDGIILAGFDGRLLYMNVSARAILGDEGAASPEGKTLHDSVRDPALRALALDLLARRKREGSAEIEIKNSAGEARRVFLCRAVTVYKDKREVGILLLLRDVTAERNLERMKQEFFHSIVHDLRSPIGTIEGFLQLLKDQGGLDERKRMYADHMKVSFQRLKQLVSDILDTAKIESGRMTLNPKPLDFPAMLDRMRSLYAIQAEMRGVVFACSAAEPPRALECDVDLIERVVMNLVSNALKFTPRGGKVALSVEFPGNLARFAVSDTGPGIPPDKLGVIFEKFRQFEGGVAVRSGYGLGLYICKRMVQMHGGRIWAESAPGEGSRFLFELPLAFSGAAAGA